MNKKILTIITEGGKEFGFGHITRCLSISNRFKTYHLNINFLINGDDSLSSLLSMIKYDMFDWQIEIDKLFLQLADTALILIDSIEISDNLILKIQSLNIPIIFIDDERRRNILTKGFVVDWTVLSDKKNYFVPRKEAVTYLLGSQYTPLRHEFKNAKKNKIKDNIESIMVTFGGSDVRNITPNILQLLTKEFPKIKKNIVIGAGFKNIENIKKYKDSNTTFIFNANTLTMINLMQNCDIAIASGGQTLYELARIGTPTIAILLVENAKDDTIGWNKIGSLKNIGWYNNKEIMSSLLVNINSLKIKRNRVKMQNRAKEYIDSNGAELLVNSIMEKLK